MTLYAQLAVIGSVSNNVPNEIKFMFHSFYQIRCLEISCAMLSKPNKACGWRNGELGQYKLCCSSEIKCLPFHFGTVKWIPTENGHIWA